MQSCPGAMLIKQNTRDNSACDIEIKILTETYQVQSTIEKYYVQILGTSTKNTLVLVEVLPVSNTTTILIDNATFLTSHYVIG